MSVPASPALSIIIVNWNSQHYLRACLQSILQEATRLIYEVIVIDNASTLDDIDKLGIDFPFIRLIRSDQNLGFARANNVGFQNSTADYVLFLNPDTVIEGSALRAMLDVLKKRQDAGIVGSRLLNSDGTLQTSCVQRYPRALNQALSTDFFYTHLPWMPLWGLAPLFQTTSDPVSVEVISGACLMVRRDVFEKVGLFSEDYFMYAEDVDLCHKVAQAGRRCYYLSSATVLHHGGGSSRQRQANNWAAVAQCGAKLQFMRKTRGTTYGNVYRLSMGATAAMRWLLLAGAAVARNNKERRASLSKSMEKWSAILRWSIRPDSTLERLTATQGH